MQPKLRHALRHFAMDLLGNAMVALSITAFAVHADFAPGGVSGLAVMANYLFAWPIGLVTLLINIPIILLTWKRLGRPFFVHSAVTMLIGALMVDHVFAAMPDLQLPRAVAAILAGIIAGIGYALIFRINSSTGGTDFIIVALQHAHPKWSFGVFTFLVDGSIILLSVPVFGDWMAFILGILYTLMVAAALDLTHKCLDALQARRKESAA